MKTHSPLIILLLWLIGLTLSCIILPSCNKCKLKEEYTIRLETGSLQVNLQGSQWNAYTSQQVQDAVVSNVRASFAKIRNIQLTEATADFRFIIDSVCTQSRAWTQTMPDPCYGERSVAYQLLWPQETLTYILNGAEISIYGRLIDTQTGIAVPVNRHTFSDQYLAQPGDPEISCQPYEPVGEGNATYVLEEAGTETGAAVCQRVKELRESD